MSVSVTVFSAKKGDYRFAQASGAWSDPSSWQIYNSKWIAASTPPEELNNVFFESDATVLISTSFICQSLHFKKATVKMYFNTSFAALSVISNATINGGEVEVAGVEVATEFHSTLIFRAKLTLQGGGKLLVQHLNIVVMQDCTFEDGEFDGAITATKINDASQHIFNGSIFLKKGRFVCTSSSSDPIYQINGDLVIGQNGTFVGINGIIGAPVLNIQGGIHTAEGGVFTSSEGLRLKKNSFLAINFSNDSLWSHKSLLSLTVSTYKDSNFLHFIVHSGRTIGLQSDIFINGNGSGKGFSSFIVQGGAVLKTNNFRILGQSQNADSRFILETDALLEIGHHQGISQVPDTSGAIQTSSRRFSETAFYAYTGIENQITGNGLPSNIKGLTINNAGAAGNDTVYLSIPDLSIGGNVCTILNGIFNIGINTFKGHNCIFNMEGGSLKVSKTSSNIVLPELQGLYNLTGGTIDLCGDGFQVIRGNVSYYNLCISGTNINGLNYKFPSSHIVINNQLEIRDQAILDAVDKAGTSVSITGEGGLLMEGLSLFRLKKLNATLPELKATAPGANYNLTGGTVELYGSGSGQTHSLNGTKGNRGADIEYFNVVIRARALNRQEGNVVLQSSIVVKNNFEVMTPASFQISNTFSLKGPGNFTLYPGATLFYGSPQGICSTSNKGNLRLSGKTSLSKEAGFGFVGSLPMESGNLLPDTCQFLYMNKKATTMVSLTKSLFASGVYFSNGILATSDSTVLSLNKDAFAENASDESHVDGPVIKYGNQSFTFPIGNGQYYRPAYISAPHITGAIYSARYFSGNPSLSFGTRLVKGLDHLSQCEYWILQRIHSRPESDTISVGLTWNEQSCGVDNPKDLRVSHIRSLAWQNDGNVDAIPGSSVNGKVQSDLFAFETAKWPFTLSSISSSNALPISLLSFEANCIHSHVMVKWTTASETNTDCFVIERSSDGVHFIKIGKVAGVGNSIEVHRYGFSDLYPESGQYYYRMRQIDRDGNFSFSDVVNVFVPDKGFTVEVFSGEVVVIHFHSSNTAGSVHFLKVFDALGREVRAFETSEQFLDLHLKNDLPCGLYFLEVSDGIVVSIKKFIL